MGLPSPYMDFRVVYEYVMEDLARRIASHVAKVSPQEPEQLISPDEAAKRLRISRKTLDRWRATRSLPFVKERATHGYDVNERKLREFIASR